MSYLATILLIGLLIFIHELGHLLAAWAVGIPVARFSLGFGPVIWSRRRHGVEYCVSLIPFGGYVMPEVADEEQFYRIPIGRRIVFSLGGPAANFVFAVCLATVGQCLAGGPSWRGLLVDPWLEVARISAAITAAIPGIFAHPQHLSGVVGIVAIGQSVVAGGAASAIRFAVMLNVNLAIFNLLPIAPLDGGKIVCRVARENPSSPGPPANQLRRRRPAAVARPDGLHHRPRRDAPDGLAARTRDAPALGWRPGIYFSPSLRERTASPACLAES